MNQKGSALIAGMIAALSVGIVSAIILQQSQVTDKQTRIPRIKSSMMMVETQLNEALNQSVIIQPCVSGVPGCFEPDHGALDAMAMEIPGAQCTTPPCGISIDGRSYAGGIFTARIVYNGTEVSIAPVNISITTSQNDAWTNTTSSCPDTEPLLVGFNQDGSRICRALPVDCGPGMYVSNIDPMSLTSGGVTCTAFPANVTCGPNQIMVGFTWTGGPNGGTPQCASLANPFAPTVLNDPTTYAYAPPNTPTYSSWPTTTLAPPSCNPDGTPLGEAYCASPMPIGSTMSPAPMCCSNIGTCTDNVIGTLTCGTSACVADGGFSTIQTCTFGSASPVVLDSSCCTGGSYCDGSQMTGTAALCGNGGPPMMASCDCSATYAGGAWYSSADVRGVGSAVNCQLYRASMPVAAQSSWTCTNGMTETPMPPGWDCQILLRNGPKALVTAMELCTDFPSFGACTGDPGRGEYNGAFYTSLFNGSSADCDAAMAASPLPSQHKRCVGAPPSCGGPLCYVFINISQPGFTVPTCN